MIGVLLRLYAVSVFGLVTASIASYFIGRAGEATTADADAGADETLRTEVAALRREIGALRAELAEQGGDDGPARTPAAPPGER